jgi:hypothetical protein
MTPQTDLLNDEIVTEPMTEFQRLSDLRQKVLDGVEIPPEEYAQVIESLRRSRTAQPVIGAKKSRASKGPTRTYSSDVEDLLGE